MADEEERPGRDEYMLTTFDNPYDPFTQFDEWYVWDARSGYHTPSLLARISLAPTDLSDADEFLAVQDAIDEIVRENVSGMHRKVKRGDHEKLITSNSSTPPTDG